MGRYAGCVGYGYDDRAGGQCGRMTIWVMTMLMSGYVDVRVYGGGGHVRCMSMFMLCNGCMGYVVCETRWSIVRCMVGVSRWSGYDGCALLTGGAKR